MFISFNFDLRISLILIIMPQKGHVFIQEVFIEILTDTSFDFFAQRLGRDVAVADKINLLNLDAFSLVDLKRDLNRICILINIRVRRYLGKVIAFFLVDLSNSSFAFPAALVAIDFTRLKRNGILNLALLNSSFPTILTLSIFGLSTSL